MATATTTAPTSAAAGVITLPAEAGYSIADGVLTIPVKGGDLTVTLGQGYTLGGRNGLVHVTLGSAAGPVSKPAPDDPSPNLPPAPHGAPMQPLVPTPQPLFPDGVPPATASVDAPRDAAAPTAAPAAVQADAPATASVDASRDAAAPTAAPAAVQADAPADDRLSEFPAGVVIDGPLPDSVPARTAVRSDQAAPGRAVDATTVPTRPVTVPDGDVTHAATWTDVKPPVYTASPRSAPDWKMDATLRARIIALRDSPLGKGVIMAATAKYGTDDPLRVDATNRMLYQRDVENSYRIIIDVLPENDARGRALPHGPDVEQDRAVASRLIQDMGVKGYALLTDRVIQDVTGREAIGGLDAAPTRQVMQALHVAFALAALYPHAMGYTAKDARRDWDAYYGSRIRKNRRGSDAKAKPGDRTAPKAAGKAR